MELLQLILFILPAYIANAAPVILGGKTPIDLGQKMNDKKRILGKGKTIRGFIAGVLAGTVAGFFLSVYVAEFMTHAPFNDKIIISFFLSLGAMSGDAIGSFIKRRIGIESGNESLVTDQLLFLGVALLFSYPFYTGKVELQLVDVAVLAIVTFFLHVAFNRIAHAAKLKKVPW